MTVTITGNPVDGSSILATAALSYTVTSSGSGMFDTFFFDHVEISTDGGSTYADIDNSGSFVSGYTGTDTVINSLSGTIMFTADAGFPAGAIIIRVSARTFNEDFGTQSFNYTVGPSGPTVRLATVMRSNRSRNQ